MSTGAIALWTTSFKPAASEAHKDCRAEASFAPTSTNAASMVADRGLLHARVTRGSTSAFLTRRVRYWRPSWTSLAEHFGVETTQGVKETAH